MWLLAILILVGIAWGAIQYAFFPPFNAETLIKIRAGVPIVSKGHLLPHVKTSLAEVLGESRISKGFVAIVPGPRVRFSRSIPAQLHQRLRNIILNQ